jgi:hypothetical protein
MTAVIAVIVSSTSGSGPDRAAVDYHRPLELADDFQEVVRAEDHASIANDHVNLVPVRVED